MRGDAISVNKFVPNKNRTNQVKNLYLKNFPNSWSKDQIEDFIEKNFKKEGEITSMGVYMYQ